MEPVGRPSEVSQAQAEEELQRQIQAAQDSRQLLSSPALAGWFRSIEEDCFRHLDNLPLSDTTGRERVVMLLGLSRKLHDHLEATVEGGLYASKQLDELLELRKKGFVERLFE